MVIPFLTDVGGVDPVPIIGGAGAVALAVMVGRFLNEWLHQVLQERRDLGNSYTDIVKRLQTEVADARESHRLEMASLRIEYDGKIANLEDRCGRSETAEMNCKNALIELHGKLAEGQRAHEDMRVQLTAALRKLGEMGAA